MYVSEVKKNGFDLFTLHRDTIYRVPGKRKHSFSAAVFVVVAGFKYLIVNFMA